MTPEPPPSRPAWKKYALALALVAGAVTFYALGLHRYFSLDAVQSRLGEWKGYADQNPAEALIVFFSVYVAFTAFSLPAAGVLTLLAGALFGRWLGTAVSSVASVIGATLAFLSSRYVLRDWVRERFAARLTSIEDGVRRDGAYYLFTLRAVPAVPFFLINLAMGLTPIPLLTFVLVSWVGMLPGTFVYCNAGTALQEIHSPRDVLSPTVIGSLVLLGVAPVLLKWLVGRRGPAAP